MTKTECLHDVFNTEITYSIANRAISIVEHRPE